MINISFVDCHNIYYVGFLMYNPPIQTSSSIVIQHLIIISEYIDYIRYHRTSDSILSVCVAMRRLSARCRNNRQLHSLRT